MWFFKNSRRSSICPQRRQTRLGVEKCEDRLMMATLGQEQDYYVNGDLFSKVGGTEIPNAAAMAEFVQPRVDFIRDHLVEEAHKRTSNFNKVPNQYGQDLSTDATAYLWKNNLVIEGTKIRDIIKVQEFSSGYVLNGHNYPYYYVSVNPDGPARETVFRVPTVRVPYRAVYVFGNAGDDNIEFIDRGEKPGTTKFLVDGGAGADLIKGGPGRDFLDGGREDSSADILYGGGGNDILAGSSGNDQLRGEGDRDLLWGEDDNDRMWGGSGIDCLVGGLGKDIMQGDSDADFLFGMQDDDDLNGGPGNDYLDGGAGTDVFVGDSGTDTFVVELKEKNDPTKLRDCYESQNDKCVVVGGSSASGASAPGSSAPGAAASLSMGMTTPTGKPKKK